MEISVYRLFGWRVGYDRVDPCAAIEGTGGDLMGADPSPRGFKRLLLCGDFHSGHHFGLTPPEWWEGQHGVLPRLAKIGKFQRALWGFATEAVERLQPVDIVIVGGDAIDGKGDKSGGVELRTTDRLEQGEMAAEFINFIDAPQVRMVFGTRYHTGKDEDFEQAMIGHIRANTTIQGHGFFNINNCALDVKHKIGGSTIPHGRMTSLARARLWNMLWSERKRQPKANIIARHHVHYHVFCGDGNWLAFTVPPLCYGSAFGIRECEGTVDIGMIVVDIFNDGRYTWHSILADFPEMEAPVEYL